ncbi:MAG: hypothetical protein MZV70_71565 [Desulfobacterales bacterium]|nr:hypothetical protein [Desulfobacterales bacterium]
MRSATWEGLATVDGAVTPELVEAIEELARGGVGLIISSHAYVRPDGQAGPRQLGAYKDELVPGLRRMATAARENGAKMVLQLAHAGCFAAEELTGTPPLVVSAAVELRRLPRPGGERNRHPGSGARLCRCGRPGQGGGLRRGAGPCRPRLSAEPVPLPALQPQNRCLWRRHPSAFARTGRSDRGRARGAGPGHPAARQDELPGLGRGGLELDDAIQAAVLLQEAGADAIEISSGLPRFSKFTAVRPGHRLRGEGGLSPGGGNGLQTTLEGPADPCRRYPVVCGGRAAW